MVIGFNKQFVEPIKVGVKLHTLRDDKKDRWQAGKAMHMATGVRTKHYDCFKLDTCKSTQETVISYDIGKLKVNISGTVLNAKTLDLFIKRDGFKSKADFISWFFPKGPGIAFKKLIHWTDLKY